MLSKCGITKQMLKMNSSLKNYMVFYNHVKKIVNKIFFYSILPICSTLIFRAFQRCEKDSLIEKQGS